MPKAIFELPENRKKLKQAASRSQMRSYFISF